jgi:endonuclease/exonuclease/phosphatase (EEP) superfamily protein YafD
MAWKQHRVNWPSQAAADLGFFEKPRCLETVLAHFLPPGVWMLQCIMAWKLVYYCRNGAILCSTAPFVLEVTRQMSTAVFKPNGFYGSSRRSPL